MEHDVSEKEEETFTLELTPSEMYSLSTILRYNIINMEDPAYSRTSEALAKTVHETMVSENFNSAMENEIESYKDQNMSDVSEAGNPDLEQSVGHGVQ